MRWPIEARTKQRSTVEIYRERYRTDPKFKKLVDYLQKLLVEETYKISEVSSASTIAVSNYIDLMGKKERERRKEKRR